jgi:hypothetical protein
MLGRLYRAAGRLVKGPPAAWPERGATCYNTRAMKLVARASISTMVVLLASAVVARASEYSGWGDTGWVYESKSACCSDAIATASRYSELSCTNTGGRPSPFVGGGQRGTCNWQLTQDGDGNTMYRCYGEASEWCDQ